jgi:hypothetical protein
MLGGGVTRILPFFLLLAACGDDRPPVPTAEQSDQLNEAEELLNSGMDEKGPEDRSSGPSSNEAFKT